MRIDSYEINIIVVQIYSHNIQYYMYGKYCEISNTRQSTDMTSAIWALR